MYNPPKCQNTHTTRPCHLLGTAQVFPSLYLGIWYLTVDSLLAVDLAAGVPLSFLRPPANTHTADTAYLLRQAGWTPTASSHCWILWIKPSVALDTASSTLSSAGMFQSYCLRIAAMETTVPSKSVLKTHFQAFPLKAKTRRTLNSEYELKFRDNQSISKDIQGTNWSSCTLMWFTEGACRRKEIKRSSFSLWISEEGTVVFTLYLSSEIHLLCTFEHTT